MNLREMAESAARQLDLVATDLQWERDETGSATWLRCIAAGLREALATPTPEPQHELDVVMIHREIGAGA